MVATGAGTRSGSGSGARCRSAGVGAAVGAARTATPQTRWPGVIPHRTQQPA